MSSNLIDQINTVLRLKGYRISKLRNFLIQILDMEDEPIAVPSLMAKLNTNLQLKPNKTTIYREIETLLKEEIVREIDLGEGKKRYELIVNKQHPHLICKKCNSIRCVKLNLTIESWLDKFCDQYNFEMQNHMLEFFGLCNECKAKI